MEEKYPKDTLITRRRSTSETISEAKLNPFGQSVRWPKCTGARHCTCTTISHWIPLPARTSEFQTQVVFGFDDKSSRQRCNGCAQKKFTPAATFRVCPYAGSHGRLTEKEKSQVFVFDDQT